MYVRFNNILQHILHSSIGMDDRETDVKGDTS